MAVYVVTKTEDVADGDGLSFREAVALAEKTSGNDTITFADKLSFVDFDDVVEITGGGKLSIDGDRDNDGVSDVFFTAGSSNHLKIGAGADVTVVNVDFLDGSSDIPQAGAIGTRGTDGAQGTHVSGHDGLDGQDGNNGQDGSDATGGGNGEDLAGSIVNEGKLTLVRCGFSGNNAIAGWGGFGGSGGFGGLASSGVDGLNDTNPYDSPLPDVAKDDEGKYVYPSATNSGDGSVPGGKGGDGGNGGDGGDGANGGNGGDAAAAILNKAGASLTLTDVVFGGRLSTGLIRDGNSAEGGAGGQGGGGGNGGQGSSGGDGGDYGLEWTFLEEVRFDDADYGSSRQWLVHLGASPGGVGGNAGIGGNGGNAGSNGNGGAAATIVNYGKLAGAAAFEDGEMTGGAAAANVSSGGNGGSGGFAPGEGGAQITDIEYLALPSIYSGSKGAPDQSPGWEGFITPYHNRVDASGAAIDPAASGIAGVTGAAGAKGEQGTVGETSDTYLNDGGTGAADSGDALVFLYGLGESWDDKGKPQISFNINRLGDTSQALTVNWKLVANGAAAVSAADFADGKLPSGSIELKAYTQFNTYDRAVNQVRVDIDIASDLIAEVPEGYRIEITSLSRKDAVLGTSSVTGTLIDTTPAVVDMPGRNSTLKGDSQANSIDGSDGNDRLFGLAGSDLLTGSTGSDTLTGGEGADRLDGGGGSDTADYSDATAGVTVNLAKPSANKGDAKGDIYVSIENLVGSRFADSLIGNAAANGITGGKGGDKLTGGGGDDVFHFTALADSTVATRGRDTILDFSTKHDRIDLSDIDASSKAGGDQDFRFIGSGHFSSKGGELLFEKHGSDVLVLGDVNGDKRADFAILADDVSRLTAADFIL